VEDDDNSMVTGLRNAIFRHAEKIIVSDREPSSTYATKAAFESDGVWHNDAPLVRCGTGFGIGPWSKIHPAGSWMDIQKISIQGALGGSRQIHGSHGLHAIHHPGGLYGSDKLSSPNPLLLVHP
jgi:hypothetical protein